jgi:predicted nucleic acid-binding Zn ribbon protein
VVSELLARRGYAQVNSAERCVEIWQAIVGPALARVSKPARIRKRVLHIVVSHSAGVQELSMRRDDILKKLATEAPELNVVGLKFKVGAFH